mgnify:CR=1 FL=1
MKTYQYKHLEQQKDETDESFLERANELGKLGWRFLYETIVDGAPSRALFEKATDEMTDLEFEMANGEMKNRKVFNPLTHE